MLISVHEQQLIIIILKTPHLLQIRLLPEHRISKMFEFYERLLTGSCQIITRQLKYPIYPDNSASFSHTTLSIYLHRAQEKFQ